MCFLGLILLLLMVMVWWWAALVLASEEYIILKRAKEDDDDAGMEESSGGQETHGSLAHIKRESKVIHGNNLTWCRPQWVISSISDALQFSVMKAYRVQSADPSRGHYVPLKDWDPEWLRGENRTTFGVKYHQRKLVVMEYIKRCQQDDTVFLTKCPAAHEGPKKLLEAITDDLKDREVIKL
ncbi:hypothetical protein BU17DRAFT_69456 [Hysterangium stoloniferum]|nr:hypothetical protein BU17DRAFT_69456 [Hysterangium stoloniferum]